jgi:hypothetical protein
MPLVTEHQLRNAIRLVACDHDPLCRGNRWQIADEDTLARLVAWTMQGHYQHAQRVLGSLGLDSPGARPTIQQQAIRRLTLPPNTEKNSPHRWHRDGLLFQHVAWIAALIENGGNSGMSMPHLRPADKGFDSILVPLTSERKAMDGVFICEEKATEHPRKEIQSNVWPSLDELEAGTRDAELNGQILAILKEYQVQNIDEVAADIYWLNRKFYRVSVTVATEHDADDRRKDLFLGYDDRAKGNVARRKAETMVVPNLRDWMDAFSLKVIAAIQ